MYAIFSSGFEKLSPYIYIYIYVMYITLVLSKQAADPPYKIIHQSHQGDFL